jgi:hypothetical protein
MSSEAEATFTLEASPAWPEPMTSICPPD